MLIRKCNSQKGQSIVEFALLLPVFAFLLFGIMEFGRLWEINNLLTSAAREGARVAAVTSPDIQRAVSAAQAILNSGNISYPTISISGPNASNEIVFTVSVDYRPLTGVLLPGLRLFRITRSTTMRWEG